MQLRRKTKTKPLTGRRPVAGAQRPNAFSYHASRIEQEYNLGRLQSREPASQRYRRLIRYWRQRAGVLLAGVIIIGCVLDILHLSANANVVINSQSSANAFLRSSSVYQQAADSLLKQSVLNGNKLTIDSARIQRQLKGQFPELADVAVTLPLIGHRPIVYVTPTEPALVIDTATAGYVLNSSGRVLLPAAQAGDVGSLKLPVLTDQSGLRPAVGAVALPSTTVGFTQTVSRELAAQNIAVERLVLPAAAYELDVYPAGAGYYVKFNLHDTASAMQQAGTYLAVKHNLESQNIKPASYIDVRLNGRAYYK